MNISENGLNLIKSFESFSPTVYICPAGKRTIGYGHVMLPNDIFTTVTEIQAEILLKRDCSNVEKTIANVVICDLTQNEYDSLCSLIYNIGGGAFRDSTMLKKLNIEDFAGAADEFLKWNHVNGAICDGLTRRRNAERDLFLQS